jgi:AraC-like DNA-binding protein
VAGRLLFAGGGFMKTVQLTHSRHLLPFAAFLTGIGEPVGPLLDQAGLPSTCLDDSKTPLPTAAMWRFRELAARRIGLPNMTSTVMEPYDVADLGAIGRAVLRAPTLLKMIETFERLVHTESSTATLHVRPCRDRGIFFSDQLALRDQEGEWHAELYVLLWMLKIVWLVDPNWSPSEVWCMSTVTPDRVKAIESLGARPRFGQRCTQFLIPRSMLALPRLGKDPCRSTPSIDEAHLRSTAPSRSVAGAIKQLLRTYAVDGWLTVNEASDLAGMSLRTMQRSLAVEGRTYSGVLEETRAEMAEDLLVSTDAAMAEISNRLGYSDQSGFTRAFRRWASVSPREFRAQRRRTRTS